MILFVYTKDFGSVRLYGEYSQCVSQESLGSFNFKNASYKWKGQYAILITKISEPSWDIVIFVFISFILMY